MQQENWSGSTPSHPLDAFARNLPVPSGELLYQGARHDPARRPAHPRIADHRRLLAAFAALPTLALSSCTQAEPPPPSKTLLTPAQAKTGFRTDEELT